ncbi:MAG: ShlB/FhaC/HecB family hemolysin secretion/activation protein [Pseudanabaena sp. M110S1SP2A07QC]|jgi:hemolysin activation/secretion protein|nr:ShlB/FhaC/HecB family hemolysin secretion/activation protein [Pseudanabaena sp. M110S1SP2A07QC]
MRPKIAELKVKLARIHPILLGLSTLALVAADCGLSANANPLSTDLTPSLSTSSISSQDLAHSSLTSPSQVAQVQTSQTQIAQAIPIKRIEVIGSTIFDADKLEPIIKPLEGKEVTEEQLTNAANTITQLYVSNGYVTSQALYTPQSVVDGIAKIQVLEGKVEKIEIIGVNALNPDYVRSRTELGIGTPLNTNNLEDQLRLLRADPNFTSVDASLKAGSKAGLSILTITVVEANQFAGSVSFDNFSAPAVGSERIGAGLSYRNLFGMGDVFTANYYRTTTGGSNQYDFGFSVPVNPMNGTVSLRFAPSNYRITQSPFDAFNIRGNSEVYAATYRQPLIRSLREEFALSLGYEYQRGQTFLFNDLAVPFGIGPESDGTSRTSVFKFGQDYTSRDTEGVWSLRSQFSLGTGLFGATYVTSPSAAFLSWLGQIQRVQVLGTDTILIGSLDTQLSADPLLPSQQFVIGGGQSLRGFRQNARSGDNGIRFSVESRFVVARNEEDRTVLQLAPFVDLGTVWNNSRNLNLLPSQNFLAGGGLGILFEPIKRLNLRLDYALPFVNLSDRGSNLQESSLYFNIGYQF